MSPDELVYLAVLAATIPVGFLFRYLSPPVKQGASLLLGLSVAIATCQIHTLHSLVTVIGTWIIVKTSWRSAPTISLAWTFLYLLFFRLVTWFGLPPPTPFANAIQLLLTLKMVSLANEIHSFHLEKKNEVSSFSKSPVIGGLSQEPSLYDILSYSYCYVGIMTGPFFRFQTYMDWLRQPSPLSLPGWSPCLQRLKLVPLYGALFLAVNSVFPLAYVRAEDFLERHFFFRLFYMVAVFFVFRMRFYAAWCGAEAGCISAGLGCYPEGAMSKPGGGPTVKYSPDPSTAVVYDFRTIQNIDCYNTDFCVKVRHGLRYWNMTVQWWLHHYIYPNAPFKSYTLRLPTLRMSGNGFGAASHVVAREYWELMEGVALHLSNPSPRGLEQAGWTMLISAYWHGLHVGYYLSFLTIPLCIAAESAMEASVRARLGPRGQSAFDWVHWFLKMRAYDYMCMGFVLLRADDTVSYWTSIYFVMHVVAVACIVLGRLLKGARREGKRAGAKDGDEAETREELREKRD